MVNHTTMALVEDRALFGSRQLDMGNVGFNCFSNYHGAKPATGKVVIITRTKQRAPTLARELGIQMAQIS